MKRAALLLGLISLIWLVGACSGGSSSGDPSPDDLAIELFWAEPATGSSPLRVTFTANIVGGTAPYYYSWDFTNDGSVDTYVNGEFKRTISVTNNYYFRASDPDVSIYNAVLTVTDSVGDSVTSDPLQVNVLGSVGFTLDPDNTGATSDNTGWDAIADKLVYIYRSNEPVYFSALPTSGTPPYEYYWDFDNNGTVDSTLATPQYTYTNNTNYVVLQKYNLEVTDANGEKVLWEGWFELQPEEGGGVLPGPFEIVLNAKPEITADGIYIDFDPTGGNLNKAMEPELDISVVVDESAGGGTPPFEYYWDFENDGALDSQAISPTIPYYDAERKILINPYMHDEDVKKFTLRCMVIDSSGRIQSEEIPVTVARWKSLDPIQVDLSYGIAAGTSFANTPPLPYAEITSARSSETDVLFNFDITGSTGAYQFQFDQDGDGNPDQVDWNGDGTLDDMTADWYALDGATSLSFTVPYASADYFATKVTLRGVDTAGNSASSVSYNLPVSLVQIKTMDVDAGILDPRRDHSMAATWTTSGNYLTGRELIIAGGRQGTSVLNAVQHVGQTYTPPTAAEKLEDLAATTVTDRSPLNYRRYGALMWAQNPETGGAATLRIHGGENVMNGLLQSNESSNGGNGAVPWTVIGETMIPDYFKLMNAGGTFVSTQGYYVIAGGINDPNDEDNNVISRKLIAYDPMFDSYSDMTNMSKGRYDCSVAFANGLIYVIGGRESNGSSVAKVEIYNPATGGWNTSAPTMNEARSGAACQVIDGKIYMIGGAYWPDLYEDPIILETSEVLNPTTGVWSYTVPMPNVEFNTNAHKMASVAVPSPGGVSGGTAYANSIVVFGGEGYEDGNSSDLGEVNRLYEFTYFFAAELPAS